MKIITNILEPKIGRKIYSRNMVSLSAYYKGRSGYPPNMLVTVIEVNENNEVTDVIASNTLYSLPESVSAGAFDPIL